MLKNALKQISEAVTIQNAISEKLCLHTITGGPGTYSSKDATGFVLYDPSIIIEKISKLKQNKKHNELSYVNEDLKKTMLGFITVMKKPNIKSKIAYNAAQIIMSNAKNGYGPMMYDIAMQFCKQQGIMPDRHVVSPSAKRIWDFYFNNRKGDVLAKPIDDMRAPITKSTKDDGDVHKQLDPDAKDFDERNPIDYVYWSKKNISFKALQQNHERLLDMIKANTYEGKETAEQFEIDLEKSSHTKFMNSL